MSYLTSSPITLDGIPLQVNESGFNVSGMSVVDEAEAWLSRERLTAMRDENDALGFDMTTITGARVRVDYVGVGHAVPINNEAVLDSLYKKILRRTVAISGSTMNAADFASFYTKYTEAQQYWARRNQYLAQLAEADITYTKVQEIVALYAGQVKPALTLVSPLISDSVTFAEGASCSFTSYVDNIVTDFSFDLIYDLALA